MVLLKNTIIATLFALATVIVLFYGMVYPAWFAQTYTSDQGEVTFQGYGIWSYYSSNTINSGNPFYSAETTILYSDFCKVETEFPNWMLGAGLLLQEAVCSDYLTIIQILVGLSAALSVLVLVLAVLANFKLNAGRMERGVSMFSFVGSIMLALALFAWGLTVQKGLFEVPMINYMYQSCNASEEDWSCWFYGKSFWMVLAAVFGFSITGYFSSAGRAEKVMRYRKSYEQNMRVAMEESMRSANTDQTSNQEGYAGMEQHRPAPMV